MRFTIILTAVVALAFAACGGDDTTDSSPSPASNRPDAGDGPPPVSGEVITADSGLQIIDIKVGDGAEAKAGTTVTVHYTGWLEDGSVFDSSVERDEPISFSLNEVIRGWRDGIPGMKVGGKRRLIIPSDLAYGEAGRPGIPSNAELTFDVELLDLP